MDLNKKERLVVVDWIDLTQDKAQFPAFVKMVITFNILQNVENSLINFVALVS
jgi:hypothetical protein